MRLTVPYQLLGEIPSELITAISAKIADDHWAVLDYRKKMVQHKGTYDSIVLRHSSEYKTATIRNMPLFAEYERLLTPIVESLSRFYSITDYVALLANLRPGGAVNPHQDSGEFLTTTHRVHVPIRTNPQSFYSVGLGTIHMPMGSVWEIDNQCTHAVINNGDTDRIHLIINIYGDRVLFQ